MKGEEGCYFYLYFEDQNQIMGVKVAQLVIVRDKNMETLTFSWMLGLALLGHGHDVHLGRGGRDDRGLGPLHPHEGRQEQVARGLAEVLRLLLCHLVPGAAAGESWCGSSLRPFLGES